jgi:RES domain-containing protein
VVTPFGHIHATDAALWSGIAYRHTETHADPLSPAGARAAGGRWNPPGEFGAVYFATPIQTAVYAFHEMVAVFGGETSAFLPRRLHVVSLTDLRLLDLRELAARERVGIDIADVVSPDRSCCQALASEARNRGFQGVITPFVTAPGDLLAIFEEHVTERYVQLTESFDLALKLHLAAPPS